MNEAFGASPDARHNERGSTRIKFLIVLAVVALIGYMSFQVLPVWYQSSSLKRFMDSEVEKAAASSTPIEQKGAWVENQLKTNGKDYGLPPDAKMKHIFQNGQLHVSVSFTRPVNILPFWTYNYSFEYTAKSTAALNTQ